MADVRLKTVERQDDPPLPMKPPAQVVRAGDKVVVVGTEEGVRATATILARG